MRTRRRRGRPRLARRDDARDHVAVAAEELRRAVQDERRPKLERALEDRRHEGRVDDDRDAARVLHRLRDVDEVERRVARRLEHDETRVRANRRPDPGRRRERHLVAEKAAGEERVAAAVERPHRDDVVLPLLSRGEEHGGERGHAGRERDRRLGALERGERPLVAGDGGVEEARVDVAAGRLAPLGERVDRGGGLREVARRVRRREVDGRRVDADLARSPRGRRERRASREPAPRGERRSASSCERWCRFGVLSVNRIAFGERPPWPP